MAAKIGLTEGTFYISATAAAGKVLLPSSTVLEGRGMGITTLQLADAGSASNGIIVSNIDRTGGNSNITLCDLTIDGNVAGQSEATYTGAGFARVTGLYLPRVEVKNVGATGLLLHGCSQVEITDGRHSNNGSDAGNATIQTYGGAGVSTGLLIARMRIDQSASHAGGISLQSHPTTGDADIQVVDNTLIIGEAHLGVEGWGVQRGTVSGNIVKGENNSNTNIYGISLGGSRLVINGNIVENCGGYAVEIGGQEVACVGNVFSNCGPALIDTICWELIYVDNVHRGSMATKEHMYITGVAGPLHIINNVFSYCQGSNSILVQDCTGTYIEIRDNLFDGASAASLTGIHLTGNTGATIIDSNRFMGFGGVGSTCITTTGTDGGRIERNIFYSPTVTISGDTSGFVIQNNPGHVTENSGSTSVADGGTITHGLVATPTRVRVSGSVAGEIVTCTSKNATTLTIAIKKHDGTAGTTQTVDWEAEVA